ncbi:hypothetical protein ACSFA8_10860 [Variovorax sp. RT4R15]|uniref:hypothetical protein n=1 Tax=Variovorax sp. RT4R15 TaxID=3443737 RepID=UPI003F463788
MTAVGHRATCENARAQERRDAKRSGVSVSSLERFALTSIPLFSADIELHDDPDEGLWVSCQDRFVAKVVAALKAAGMKPGATEIEIQGTENLPAQVRIPVAEGTFDDMHTGVKDLLLSAGVTIAEENFSMAGERFLRLHLTNVPVWR